MVLARHPKRRCLHCNGWLRSIGHDRKNGRGHADWEARKYHKKCIKIINAESENGFVGRLVDRVYREEAERLQRLRP